MTPTKRIPYEEQYFVDSSKPVWNYSLFTDEDIRSYQYGTHCKLYQLFGNKNITVSGKNGTYFSVWAPSAKRVSVIGDFNQWNTTAHLLNARQDSSGIWEGFIPNIAAGELYKYNIISSNGESFDKGDPYANYWEKRPKTASITTAFDFQWQDKNWMKKRKKLNALDAPISVYEVHPASWMRPNKDDEESYNSYQLMIELL
ncbi:MAG: 1,4-alpha-glucan branching protein GlgB, partial [Arachidicoccus sp.]